jgi:thiol:disulfide interchange protein DsbG
MVISSFSKSRFVAIPFLIAMLSGCGGGSDVGSTTPAVQLQPTPYDVASKDTKGFTVGSTTSTNTVYVMFDPQCPHCASLWRASLPLHNKVKFMWVPVALLNAKSKPQGAAILGATNPLIAMTLHEESYQAGTGGIALPPSVSPELDTAITKNTDLMKTIGASSVPYIIAKHAKTGAILTQAGTLSTAALTDFLGVN